MYKTIFSFLLIITGFIAHGKTVDLTSYLPKGHSEMGDIDYTQYLQQGLDDHLDVEMPNFPILINSNGLNLRDFHTVRFNRNSALIMKPNSENRYALINIKNLRNVKVINPRLVGDRQTHQKTTGEWGMGIYILSSENIEICNANISDCYGDGIYLGEIHYTEQYKYKLEKKYCNNVRIEGGIINNCRRNGISIINAKNVTIADLNIDNSNGTAPETGICLEPNSNSQNIERIKIENVRMRNNRQYGIAYVPSRFYGKESKSVEIIVDNCTVSGSEVGVYIGGRLAKNKGDLMKHSGSIMLRNMTFSNNKLPIRSGSNQSFNPKVSITKTNLVTSGKAQAAVVRRMITELKKNGIDYR